MKRRSLLVYKYVYSLGEIKGFPHCYCGLFPVKGAICGHKRAKHRKMETLTWERH